MLGEFSLSMSRDRRRRPQRRASIAVVRRLDDARLEARCLLAASLGGLWSGQSGFVMDPGQSITTNTGRQFTHASIIKVGAEYRAYATDSIPDGDSDPNNDKYAVRLFTSADALQWIDQGFVVTPQPGTYYDRMASFPGVLQVGSTFYMAFEAQKLGSTADIGLATSTDGVNWTVSAQPILTHTGSGYEAANIGTPSLYYENGQFTLFYHAFDWTDCRVFAATGTSLTGLTRANGGQPIINTSGSGIDSGTIGKRSQVFKEGGYYYMAIEVSSEQAPGTGYAGSNWSTIMVRSQSLTSGWQKLPGTVLPQTGSGFGYDGPEMVDVGGQIRIYARDKTGVTRIATLAESTTQTFEAENMYHQIGRADADGWSVNVTDTPNRYLSYGPYTTAIASGARTATFRLMLDNVTADNNQILTLDVYDASTGRILATRTLTRQQFTAAWQYQDFDLNFSANAGQLLEFRTFWRGSSYARQDNVKVR